MTLKHAYATAFLLATTSAMLSVLLGGSSPVAAWLSLLAPLAFLRLYLGPRLLRPLLTRLGTAIGFVATLYGATIIIQAGVEQLVTGASTALLGILAGRIVSREHTSHDLQALLLSLLLVFAGAVTHPQLTYGITFVLYAVSASWALVLRQLTAGELRTPTDAPSEAFLARRDVVTPRFFIVTGALALFTLASTSFLFVAFPRVGFGNLAFLRDGGHRLPESVRLDQAPRRLAASDEVVARVAGLTFSDFARGVYLRAAHYDRFDGKSFAEGEPRLMRRAPLFADSAMRSYEVFLLPLSDARLPVLGPLEDAEIVSGGLMAGVRTLRTFLDGPRGRLIASRAPDGPVRYRVHGYLARKSTPTAAPLDAPEEQEVTDARVLPENLDSRIAALAAQLTNGATTPAEKARRIKTYLLQNYAYSLDVDSAAAVDPLISFLFTDKRGHCEFFAAAYAVLLRAAGVPARVVSGFAFGSWDGDEQGVIVFTAQHAHAWVEWHLVGAGWVLDDATPASEAEPARLSGLASYLEQARRLWDTYVLDYGLDTQLDLAKRALAAAPRLPALPRPTWQQSSLMAALLLLSGLALSLWRRRRQRTRDILGLLPELLVRVSARTIGRPIASSETVREAVLLASSRLHADDARAILLGLELYEQARFAECAPPVQAVSESVTSLRHLLRS